MYAPSRNLTFRSIQHPVHYQLPSITIPPTSTQIPYTIWTLLLWMKRPRCW